MEVESVPLEQNGIHLKIECDFKDRTDKTYFYYSFDGLDSGQDRKYPADVLYPTPLHGYRFAVLSCHPRDGRFVDFDYYRVDGEISNQH